MNFLQITDSRPLSQQRKKCIQSLKDKIGDNNYEMIEIPFTNVYDVVYQADKIRLSRAAEDPNLCYVDTDCFIAHTINWEVYTPGVPLFGASYCGPEKHPDIFLFCVNRACDYFRAYLNESLIKPEKYSVPFEVLKGLEDFKYIQELSYFHMGVTTEMIIAEKEKAQMKFDLDKTVLKLAALRKHVELMAITLNG